MPITIMRRIKFCAGHRLLNHGGKCEHLHGHNYRAEFYVTAETQDAVGRVIDFSVLKERFKGWIDEHWDHGFVLWERDEAALAAIRQVKPTKLFLLPYNPTSENLAKYLLLEASPKLLDGLNVQTTRVVVWETDDSFAEASLEG